MGLIHPSRKRNPPSTLLHLASFKAVTHSAQNLMCETAFSISKDFHESPICHTADKLIPTL